MMHISRLRLYGVKPLRRDIPEGGKRFSAAAQRRLLLQGANGSGKTTVLEVIATLWSFFGEWLDVGAKGRPPLSHLKHYVSACDLAAMEVSDLLPNGKPLWIAVGKVRNWVDLTDENTNSEFAGLVDADGRWEISLPPIDLRTYRQKSMVGSEPRPNIVYFPPDHRTVIAGKKGRAELVDMTGLNWLARYGARDSLDSLLLTSKAHSTEWFEEALSLVNTALERNGKQITGFGTEGRLRVEGATSFGVKFQHYVDDLSSGEKQLLLLTAFTASFLRERGILLIDEPDLHIHMSMMEHFLELLHSVARQRHAQLIIASHSELVWNWFARDSEVVELSPWRGE